MEDNEDSINLLKEVNTDRLSENIVADDSTSTLTIAKENLVQISQRCGDGQINIRKEINKSECEDFEMNENYARLIFEEYEMNEPENNETNDYQKVASELKPEGPN